MNLSAVIILITQNRLMISFRNVVGVVFSICFMCSGSINGQSKFEKGWQSLNETKIEEATGHFESALKNPLLKEKSLLCLTLLNSQLGKEEQASKYFNEFFDNSSDPYPELYSMWFENGVTGKTGKKNQYQLDLLKKIAKDDRNIGKLDAGTQYRLGFHYVMSFDKVNAAKHFDNIQHIDSWMMLGPFDNVVNSGYDKDFDVVSHPEAVAKFNSKYGGEISWFEPPLKSQDGYMFQGTYFLSNNSIVYAQTFIESPNEQEVILNFGYSGSMKFWINDSLIYRNPDHRITEMDYFRFNCTLNKGHNRLLVQLGDYDETLPNFTMRITDSSHNSLSLPRSNKPQQYQKGISNVERIPYFAIAKLEEKAKEDVLYKILLAMAYKRSNELDKAEAILLAAYEKEPRNFFVLRSLVLHYDKSSDNTNQNKFYELFAENYPNDINVLQNKIDEFIKEKDKKKTKEYIGIYLSKYYDPYEELSFDLNLAGLENNNEEILLLYDSIYRQYPDDYTAVVNQYSVEKSHYSNPVKANEILKKYLVDNYDSDIVSELARNFVKEGKIDSALVLLQKQIDLVPYGIETYSNIVNLLSRQSKYDEAIEVCKTIIENRPSDYNTLHDLAILNNILNNKKLAISYYEEALNHFPFSFEINEKIRELKGLKRAVDLVPNLAPSDIIKEYESNFTPKTKQSYDVVVNSKYLFVFNSKASARIYRYILKINDEDAIKKWQRVDFSPPINMDVYINDVEVIKKNGNRILAERNDNEVVFTNLELGDYIYVSYSEKQVNGGKSAMFISDSYSLNSYSPTYSTEYNLYLEDDLKFINTVTIEACSPEVSKEEGFTKYQWIKHSPATIKAELNSLPFSDLSQIVHVSLDYSWKDIVQWYSDLSGFQAKPDFTIKKIANELFDGKHYSDDEKFQVIYDFVLTNIQYSSIDFRQSGHIPQKASTVYHTRLGDCKDVSTLYVSLARAAGLQANLVLINTSNNGKKDVLLPSLNFNHCIVKVYLKDGYKYLELTDRNLPYGYLYNYHNGAAILEIPINNISEIIGLEYLKTNANYNTEVIRNTSIKVDEDSKMRIEKSNIKTGTQAASICKSYYNIDEEARVEKLKGSVSDDFKSHVTIDRIDFKKLKPREDSAQYSYSFTVDNDVLNLGSFKTFKIPFTDVLVRMNIFENTHREHEFDFMSYEDSDYYIESIRVELSEIFSLSEIPKDIYAEYNGCTYDLKFEKINDREIKIDRVYRVNRVNVQPEDFPAFKVFMTQVNDAENTHVLFK